MYHDMWLWKWKIQFFNLCKLMPLLVCKQMCIYFHSTLLTHIFEEGTKYCNSHKSGVTHISFSFFSTWKYIHKMAMVVGGQNRGEFINIYHVSLTWQLYCAIGYLAIFIKKRGINNKILAMLLLFIHQIDHTKVIGHMGELHGWTLITWMKLNIENEIDHKGNKWMK